MIIREQCKLNIFEKMYVQRRLKSILNKILQSENPIIFDGNEDNHQDMKKYLGMDFSNVSKVKYFYRIPNVDEEEFLKDKSVFFFFYMPVIGNAIRIKFFNQTTCESKKIRVENTDPILIETFKEIPNNADVIPCSAVTFEVPYYKTEDMKTVVSTFFNKLKKEWN